AAHNVPVLGICVGHQGLAIIDVAGIKTAAASKHGFISTIRHAGVGLFANIPQDFTVVRYHSLYVDDIDSTRIQPLAWSEDGVIMAVKVLDKPHWGVQFHPESILTEHGRTMMENFFSSTSKTAGPREETTPAPAPQSAPGNGKLQHRTVPLWSNS